ncbi:MAG TPA: Ig-like domain-containing protein [Tepidisphaeraceae bacterium]|nr:Ig-like domain-containing protein [Tepidisphaeraceae bacterium]
MPVAPWVRSAHRRQFRVEPVTDPLEHRALLASLGPDGTLSVPGTVEGEVIVLDRSGESIVVDTMSLRQTFPAADVRRVEVLSGGGNDRVSVGDGLVSQAGAALPITVDGGAGDADFLGVLGSAGAERFHVTPTSVAAGPAAGGGVDVTIANVERFNALAGPGNDAIFLADTSGRFSENLLAGGEGDDTFTVGDGVTPNTWRYGVVQNSAVLDGGAGDDAITYNDQASVGTSIVHGYRLMQEFLSRGPGTAFQHPGFERVTLNTSNSADSVEVILLENRAGTELFVNAGRSDAPGMPNPMTGRNTDSLHAPWRFNASNATLTMSGPDAGRYTFTGNYPPVNFTGIEEIYGPDLARPTVTGSGFRTQPRQGIEVRFSEDVRRNVQPGDLTLVDVATGQPAIAGLPQFASPPGAPLVAVWTPGAPLAPGTYRATVTAAGIQDDNGNPMAGGDYVFEFVVPASQVAGRHVFYNNSAFDGNDGGAGAADDNAIATDKSALWVGGPAAASFSNVTSYNKGINGVMVDVAGLPGAVSLSAADFIFEQSRGGAIPEWFPAAPPHTVTVRRGAGVNGSDRVTLRWTDYNPAIDSDTLAVANAWLRVTVRANARTALAEPHTFYFGNLIGETGDAFSRLRVSVNDALQTRRNFFSAAPITSRFDFNRDGRVGVTDFAISRSNLGRTLETPNVPIGPVPPAAEDDNASAGAAAVLLTEV